MFSRVHLPFYPTTLSSLKPAQHFLLIKSNFTLGIVQGKTLKPSLAPLFPPYI